MNQNLNYANMIAACGMNCGICIGHMRDKKPCGGCFRKDDDNKPKQCRSCNIVNCEFLKEIKSGFCFDCPKYPCVRLKRLDNRYRKKYKMSMIENLDSIKKVGLESFIRNEENRWICKVCGSGLSVHRDYCLNCKEVRI
ncbi:MAG: DUF3795 domain-containing protein [Bacteroidetes bacterium]|jgi:hypothetical protein|nr:DUF3795 domain-containing protein [Bacteroidota bacterium]MBT6686557.1 DUF3795 domain-containing protein [Bacteroidota bacterium]MBT7142920.1 DUF3795 domain-containing protein [Bacteroidota bacterium]MBT7490631.1 DUF3795 domain-containing protein [Bacteroidota bacterium]